MEQLPEPRVDGKGGEDKGRLRPWMVGEQPIGAEVVADRGRSARRKEIGFGQRRERRERRGFAGEWRAVARPKRKRKRGKGLQRLP